MHGTRKGETCDPPEATPADQQRRFDLFRQEFNDERPHEALGPETPVTLYSASPRPFPERLEAPCYGPSDLVLRVRPSGQIQWRNTMVFISAALIAHSVALLARAHPHCLIRSAQRPTP